MKHDLILVALYQLAYSGEMKVNELTKELIEYLKRNYIPKNKKDSFDFESIVMDTLYGNNGDVNAFLRCVKEHTIIKKKEKK